MKKNRIMDSDSYKFSHTNQYPSNTVGMYDYAEARSSKMYESTVFFGLQYILKEYFSSPITVQEVQEAKMFAQAHGIPFNEKGWMYIASDLQGKLPVKIKAIPEGTVVPTNIPLFTVESTDEKVYWVVSWLETVLMRVWYPSNIATRSYFVKQMLKEFANKTQDNPFVLYQFHNFGSRGSSTQEAASIGGVAHLTQFMGTDNFNSLKYAQSYYNVTDINTIGHSIPASEHSSTTAWTKEKEMDMIFNHIENNKGAPIIAAVCDSYDYFKAVDTITGTEKFRSKIDSNEYPIFVIRPDSGNPEDIIPKTIDIMEENGVPFTVNKKGFKVWDKFRIIWGDGITQDTMKTMLEIIVDRGYSSENISFGSGGWLMQQHDRDSQGWAVKCSSITVENLQSDSTACSWMEKTERDVFKDPVTAPNKKSKKGKVTTYYNPSTNTYFVDKVGKDFDNPSFEVLKEVYKDGLLTKEYTLDEIRNNSDKC